MALSDDLTQVATDLATVTTDVSTAQAAVEQAVTDLNSLPSTSPSVGDNLLNDVVTFLEGQGYTVTPPAPAPVAGGSTTIPVTDGTVADNTPSA